MALIKHEIECTGCEYQGFVISNPTDEPPAFCPQCGENLNESEPQSETEAGG